MKNRFTLLFTAMAALFSSYDVAAQCFNTPCPNGTPLPAYDAVEACILPSEQSLNCYFGETIGSTPVSLPPVWCTTIENNLWFAFMASGPNLSFDLSVSNCIEGGALQAALFQTFDCVNFDFVSDCFGNIVDGTTQTISNIVPLTPGEVYYLMIDGSAGAKCQFSINSIGSISGPDLHCIPSPPSTYFTNSDAFWTISPPSAGTILTTMPASSIMVQWLQPGTASICSSSTGCANMPSCKQVFVGESFTDTITSYLCPGEEVVCSGQVYTNPGSYINYAPSPNGCDSIIYCEVIALPPTHTQLGQVIMPCDGDFSSCGETFTELGFYETTCQSWLGCDSTVSFLLLQGDVLANAGQDITLPCQGGQVILNGSASSQGGNFAYQWATADGNIASGETTVSPAIDAVGTYCLTVTNLNTGCVMTDCVRVANRVNLSLTGPDLFCENSSGNLGYQVQVNSSTNATLYYQIGNAAPQTIQLSAGSTNTNLYANLDSTTLISVWAVDATNCASDTLSILVEENMAVIEFDLLQNVCNIGELTAILVGNHQNTPVSFLWNNGETQPTITVNQDGYRSVTITDNFGCSWSELYFVTLDFTGLCAYIEGSVRRDLAGNCVLSGDDTHLNGRIVRASATDGTNYYGLTDVNGYYFMAVPPGAYTLRALVPIGNGFVACGNDFTVNLSGVGATFTQDFLLYQTPDCPYMTVDVANSLLRRCSNNSYSVNYCNHGSTIAEDAQVVLTLDPALTFLTATVPYISLGSNMFQFELGDLAQGQCGSFLINTFLDCNVPIGQVHCVVADVFPNLLCAGYGPNDFTDTDCRPNIGSYDPNVKTADPPGAGNEHFIAAGTELTYQIRFQNTGTDTAFNVLVRDTLMDKFDFSTLRPGASSHPFTMDFYGQRVLKFKFDDIKLPPIGTNEMASIGFLEFSIRLKDDLPQLDVIENQASVYFDNNAPVATNTYFHTIPPNVVVTNLNGSFCEGLSYNYNGISFNQAGEYTFTLTSITGADSIVNLILTEHPIEETLINEEICQGESVVFNGDTLTESGDLKLVFQTIHGCDSIVNFSLDVWPVYDLQPNVQVCIGTSYELNGQILTQSGTYLAQMLSTHGCDSTVTLHLEVVDSFDIQLNESICEGESYLFDGQALTQPGAYFAEYETAAGCDSTVALNLAVWPNFLHTVNISICEGNAFDWEGQAITDAGIYADTLLTVHGCDSIIILIVEVLPNSETTINATICQGDTYLLEGQPYDITGTYTALLINSYGCDSLLTLNLSVNPAPVVYDTLSVVQGTIHNGITLLSDTTVTEVQMDDFGCETIISTHLIVLPNATQDVLEGSSFEVFPNPASGQFFVRFDLMRQRNVRLEVLDVLGRVLYANSAAKEFATGKHQLAIQAKDWPSGVYFVRLGVGEAGFAKKIVVESL
ncbi:MAG: T9SS type A sorting domain-containing protein [Saprospiraceae bacterium]|nr:T9SS type A sorting domain-containing protein [Saprospiraceae bacterium]